MQTTDHNTLTATEQKVYSLNGVGRQTKEIAETLQSSYETVKCHMRNIKTKLGLQKDKELTAHYWCSLTGKDFAEIRRKVISSCLLLIIALYIPISLNNDMRTSRSLNRAPRQTAVARRGDYV